MGRVKAYYHEELNNPKHDQHQDRQMSEAELEAFLDKLQEEWLLQHEAYRYEDNYNTFGGANTKGGT